VISNNLHRAILILWVVVVLLALAQVIDRRSEIQHRTNYYQLCREAGGSSRRCLDEANRLYEVNDVEEGVH
jgi:hypothetical protein